MLSLNFYIGKLFNQLTAFVIGFKLIFNKNPPSSIINKQNFLFTMRTFFAAAIAALGSSKKVHDFFAENNYICELC